MLALLQEKLKLENVNYVVLPRKSLILITQKSNPIHRRRQTTLISNTQQPPNRDSHSAKKTTAPSTPTNTRHSAAKRVEEHVNGVPTPPTLNRSSAVDRRHTTADMPRYQQRVLHGAALLLYL